MKAKDVEVGATYSVKLHGAFAEVRVKKVDRKAGMTVTGRKIMKDRTHYICENLKTGREIMIKSAAKFRREVTMSHGQKLTVSSAKPSNQNIKKPEGEKGSDPTRADTQFRGGSDVTQIASNGTLTQDESTGKEGEQRPDPTPVSTTSLGGSANPVVVPPIAFNITGSCGWQPRNELGFPRFSINGRVYDFKFIPFGIELSYLDEKMVMVAWKVTCSKVGVPVSCNCPSDGNGTSMTRCKHVRALKAAIPQAPYSLV